MSIATQITRLQNIKTAIRNALVNKGVTSASTHDMDDFATDIGSIPTGGTYQSKTVSPSTSQQTVAPDSGYDALSQVTVNAVSLQNKSVTPTSSSQTVTADSGYIGLNQVTVGASTGIDTSDATAYAANVVSPYTFYARGNKYTGSITPRSLTTGSNLGYSRIDSGYYSNSYSVSANSPIFESVYMSSSRQMSLTETHSVSRSPGDLTMVVLSTTNTDYTEEILQTTGGLAQGILAIGFIPSIDVMYVEFELRFNSNGMNYIATISYSSGQYTVTLNSLPLSSYRPYFQVYRVANKGFSLS